MFFQQRILCCSHSHPSPSQITAGKQGGGWCHSVSIACCRARHYAIIYWCPLSLHVNFSPCIWTEIPYSRDNFACMHVFMCASAIVISTFESCPVSQALVFSFWWTNSAVQLLLSCALALEHTSCPNDELTGKDQGVMLCAWLACLGNRVMLI